METPRLFKRFNEPVQHEVPKLLKSFQENTHNNQPVPAAVRNYKKK